MRSVFNQLTDPYKHKLLTTVSSLPETSWFDLVHLSIISFKLNKNSAINGQGRKLLDQVDQARKSDPQSDQVFVHLMLEALPLLLQQDSGVMFDATEIKARLVTVLGYFVFNSSIIKGADNVTEANDDSLEHKVINVISLAFDRMQWDSSLVQQHDPLVCLVRLSHALSSASSNGSSGTGRDKTGIKREPMSSHTTDAPMDLSVPSSHKKQRTS